MQRHEQQEELALRRLGGMHPDPVVVERVLEVVDELFDRVARAVVVEHVAGGALRLVGEHEHVAQRVEVAGDGAGPAARIPGAVFAGNGFQQVRQPVGQQPGQFGQGRAAALGRCLGKGGFGLFHGLIEPAFLLGAARAVEVEVGVVGALCDRDGVAQAIHEVASGGEGVGGVADGFGVRLQGLFEELEPGGHRGDHHAAGPGEPVEIVLGVETAVERGTHAGDAEGFHFLKRVDQGGDVRHAALDHAQGHGNGAGFHDGELDVDLGEVFAVAVVAIGGPVVEAAVGGDAGAVDEQAGVGLAVERDNGLLVELARAGVAAQFVEQAGEGGGTPGAGFTGEAVGHAGGPGLELEEGQFLADEEDGQQENGFGHIGLEDFLKGGGNAVGAGEVAAGGEGAEVEHPPGRFIDGAGQDRLGTHGGVGAVGPLLAEIGGFLAGLLLVFVPNRLDFIQVSSGFCFLFDDIGHGRTPF